MKNILLTDVLCLKPGLKVSGGLIHVCTCVFVKTHATFLTAPPAKCLAHQRGSGSVGAHWLSDFTPDKQACFSGSVKAPCCKLENWINLNALFESVAFVFQLSSCLPESWDVILIYNMLLCGRLALGTWQPETILGVRIHSLSTHIFWEPRRNT